VTFQPVVPSGGLVGWQFLQSTLTRQQAAHRTDQSSQRIETYFRENIGKVSSAEDLVSDRRLLTVALTAFGLEEDINAKAFVTKVLEDGTLDPNSLANRLSDSRYKAFSAAFGFGDFSVPRTVLSDFPDKILERYHQSTFQAAVGEIDSDMRLGLGLAPGLADVLDQSIGNDARWFGVMGSRPLRTVFERAFGLPTSFGTVDLDQQLTEFKKRAESFLGTDDLGEIASSDKLDRLARLMMAQSQNSALSMSSASTALALLQG